MNRTPRPDTHGPHSDLCIQGMFYALEHDVDLWAYHDLMYKAAQKSCIDIEDIDALAISDGTPQSSKEPRPVFSEEMRMLHMDNMWEFDFQNNIPYMWAAVVLFLVVFDAYIIPTRIQRRRVGQGFGDGKSPSVSPSTPPRFD